MKKLTLIAVLISVVLFNTSGLIAAEFSKEKKEATIENLLVGIKSENPGLRTSAVLRIFECIEYNNFTKDDFTSAVIPLMKILRNGETEKEKLAAALLLYTIEDERGIYLLRGSVKFDENEKVQKTAKHLYINYHLKNDTSYLIDF